MKFGKNTLFGFKPRAPLFVPHRVLLEMEEELGRPTFQGVPIGATLADLFLQDLYLGKNRWAVADAWKARLRYAAHWLLGPRIRRSHRANVPTPTPGKILVTWLAERPHFRDLVMPVIKAVGPGLCIVLCARSSMLEKLPEGCEGYSWDQLAPPDLAAWRRDYRRCAGRWHKTLRTALRKHGLPRRIAPHIQDTMLVNSQVVAQIGTFLELARPRAVLTEFDRSPTSSCLVKAAQHRGVPTFTMIHGVVNPPYGMIPLLADLALCWGERQREQFIELGTDPRRLRVVGCQRLNPELEALPASVKSKLGLPLEQPLVMLATNPIAMEDRRTLARTFCEGVVAHEALSAIVRLHPSERLDDYRTLIEEYPSVRFLGNETLSLDESIAAADVVVCHNSGVGHDALIKGRLVVVLDVLPTPLGNGTELIEEAGCPRARGAREFLHVLTRVLTDPLGRSGLEESRARYVHGFCSTFGEDAARNIARILLRAEDFSEHQPRPSGESVEDDDPSNSRRLRAI